jgi:hypothetical protein
MCHFEEREREGVEKVDLSALQHLQHRLVAAQYRRRPRLGQAQGLEDQAEVEGQEQKQEQEAARYCRQEYCMCAR